MAQAKSNLEWKAPPEEAKKLAYKIQEAFASATALKIAPYDKLRDGWRIKLRHDTVIAEYVYGPDSISTTLQFPNITDALDVIETIIRHKTVDFDLLFPSLNDPLDEMIVEYCTGNGYEIANNEPAGKLIKRGNTNAST